MTPAEIAAYIGALAWVPQILGWIYKAIVKPKVLLVPGPTLEVGYTTFGPICNIRCAISASRTDAIIQNITLTLRHERGESTIFTWSTLTETFSEIRSDSGESAEVSKNQPAIALKVSTLVLAEKVINFLDLNFQERNRALMNTLTDIFNHNKKTISDYAEQTVKSKQFSDLSTFYENNFIWHEGNYKAELKMRLAGVRKPTIQFIEFSLSAGDVDRLKQNISLAQRFHTEIIKPPLKEQQAPYLWSWINPHVTKSTSNE